MTIREEIEEVEEVKEVTEAEKKSGGVAAFFDLDGTLMPLPSLEKRFVRFLRQRNAIGIANYFLWLAEAGRLAPRGIGRILYANKMYLHGVPKSEQRSMNIPPLYPQAAERAAWHAERGDLIVIVSGTLEALAEKAARELEAEIGARGAMVRIRVFATRLEESGEPWTGRIAGEAMFGEAKARAIRRIAAEVGLDLQRCFAYGDSANDRWMLEAVGKPAAVNPSNDLARIARRNRWPVLRWAQEKDFTLRTQRTHSSQRRQEARATRRTDAMREITQGADAARMRTDNGV